MMLTTCWHNSARCTPNAWANIPSGFTSQVNKIRTDLYAAYVTCQTALYASALHTITCEVRCMPSGLHPKSLTCEFISQMALHTKGVTCQVS